VQPRPRFVVVLTLVFSLCLALAAGAGAKPHPGKAPKKGSHKAASPLRVKAPKKAQFPVGVPAKVKVKVANRGKKPIAGVVLVAKGSKAVKVKPAKVKVGKLKARQAKATTFTVTVSAAGKRKLEFVAKAPGRKQARKAVALRAGAAPQEEAKRSAIVGLYFWNTYSMLMTTYMHGYYFVDEKWVYRGVPKEGLPACTAQTATGEEDGCLPYTWDEATGALNIAGVVGEYKVGSHALKVGEEYFGEAALPEPGTRIDASAHYINQYGLCPLTCTFVNVDLQMSSNGEFARASGVAGFFGEGGSYGALPPEDHGTYAIDPRGRITFTYADGHVVVETIAFMLDAAEVADPNYGMLLGESVYFGPHSDT
jgi:hypothetical protein